MADDTPAKPSFFVIPIDIKRRLKAAAALRGYTMRAFVTAAIVARVEEIEREEREEAERAPVRATGT